MPDSFNSTYIINELSRNRNIFSELLKRNSSEEYLWKQSPDKWCLLEIVCHLYDEEREDFRSRLKHVLETPSEQLPSIDPPAWVTERNYIGQNYDERLQVFLRERDNSIEWLK